MVSSDNKTSLDGYKRCIDNMFVLTTNGARLYDRGVFMMISTMPLVR